MSTLTAISQLTNDSQVTKISSMSLSIEALDIISFVYYELAHEIVVDSLDPLLLAPRSQFCVRRWDKSFQVDGDSISTAHKVNYIRCVNITLRYNDASFVIQIG
jgi:hypothetical protein